jgi:dihydroorotate dehydrogenase electron transfer subunit
MDILMTSELEAMGARLKVTTEDGSLGTKGMVTHLLEASGPSLAEQRNILAYACGPPAMLARVACLSEKFSIPCQVSLEARMACGVGSCLGCVVRTKSRGYQRVCKEGPVFGAEEVVWEGIERLL